jgi:molybdate transport system substrate-binding protein
MIHSNRAVRVAAAGVLIAALISCGDDDDDDSAAGAAGGEVTVFAAASLTDAFTEIGEAFELGHPDASVTFNFAASSDLVTQIDQGAPADVFASADEANMTKLTDAGNNGAERQVFATNRLEIIVQPGNPHGIAEVADLADPDLVVVTCAPEVPIGAYSAEVFSKAGVEVTPDSLEENVRAVVTKVTLGEADAGIVYRTDVLAAGDEAEGVEIPDELNVTATYPIAVTSEASNPDGAAAFVEFVLASEGQDVLARYGFTGP